MSGAIVGGAIAAAGALGGAAIASSGASKAASAQTTAADQAAQLQYQASQNALDFQKQQYAQDQQNLQPWLKSGTAGLANLNYLLGVNPGNLSQPSPSYGSPMGPDPTQPGGSGIPGSVAGSNGTVGASASGLPTTPQSGAVVNTPGMGLSGAPSALSAGGGQSPTDPLVNTSLGGFGSLMTPYSGKFTAPTDITEQNDPGYQARLKMGTDALQKSAAARGSLLTGGTAKALDSYAQDYASNEYGNVYNRALTGFTTNYNQYNQDQATQYNRLAALAGAGQATAGQLATLGQNSANSMANTVTQGAAAVNQQNNNAAAATASGYAAGGNIWGSALSGLGNNLSNLYQLQNQPSYNSAGYAVDPRGNSYASYV